MSLDFKLWSEQQLASGLPILEFLNKTVNGCNQQINIFSPEETFFFLEEDTMSFNEIEISFLKKHNVTCVFGGINNSHYLRYESLMNIVTWPTFFFNKTLTQNLLKIPKIYNNRIFNKTFISLNHKPRHHRCLLIDIIIKEKLENLGYISFRNLPADYTWKWWKTPSVLLLSDKWSNNTHDIQWSMPDEGKFSFISLVSETTVQSNFITEKTVVPILYGNLFLILAGKGFHQYLESLGFELYYELFDYSFDNEENLEKRIDGIVKNIKKFNDLSLLTNSYQLVIDKVKRNQNNIIKIFQNKKLIPDCVLNNSFANNLYYSMICFDNKY
jgi:hypothetical protein